MKKINPPHYLSNRVLAEEIRKCQIAMEVSHELAKMLMQMVDRLSLKANWRNYSFVADMKAEALHQLVRRNTSSNRWGEDQRPNILKFDFGYAERNGVSPNPFAYATQIITNAFRRCVRLEHGLMDLRDDLLIEADQPPSARRQAEMEANRSAEPILPRCKKPAPRRKKAEPAPERTS